MKKQNGSISEQLKNIKNSNTHFSRSKMFNLPPVNSIGEDGVDHINIWESGYTNLGKALSSFTALPFKHNVYGKFISIEGFWHYIRSRSKDDNLRHLSGYNARAFGRSIESDNVQDMYFIIADANWQKIITYPSMVEEIKNLHIPFDSYYFENRNVSPVRARSLHSTWLVPAFHEIHEAIHQNREPDFNFLKDRNKDKFYNPLIKKERSEGGCNSDLLDLYRERPTYQKSKQNAVLTSSENIDSFVNQDNDYIRTIDQVEQQDVEKVSNDKIELTSDLNITEDKAIEDTTLCIDNSEQTIK